MKSVTNVPCTPSSAKLMCSPAEVNTHRKINLDHTLQSQETQQTLGKLCEEYKAIFLLHQGDIGHAKLLTMDIDTGDHPPIVQKPYTLPLKHSQWVHEELGMLEKAGIISKSDSPWSIPIVIVSKKSEPGEIPQKHLCVDCYALNSLLPPVLKAHSKAQGVLFSTFTKN